MEKSLRVRPLVFVPAPVLPEIKESWLGEKVAFHLSLADAYHNAVAAGLWLQLHTMDEKLGGFPRSEDSPAHLWVQGLSADQRESILQHTIARVSGLWGDLETLIATFDLENVDWQAALFTLCEERVQLEGVRILLNQAKVGQRLETVLSSFDLAAMKFVRSIPFCLRMDSEFMARAAVVNPYPFYWWTIFVCQ